MSSLWLFYFTLSSAGRVRFGPFIGAALHFFWRYIFNVGRHVPNMTEGVPDLCRPISVELVGERREDLCAGVNGASNHRIDIRKV